MQATPDAYEMSVRHIGSGKYGDVFSVRDAASGHSVAMKISYYRDCTLAGVARCARRGDISGALRAKKMDAVSVSSQFARLTAARLLHTVSPHFVVMYEDMDCDRLAERLRHLLATRLSTLTPAQRRHTNVCFMERFDGSLTDWLLRTPHLGDAAMRGVTFQVLYTLAALQRALPGVRHNDLSTNNVLVRHVPQGVDALYTCAGRRFRVSRVPVLVAMTDYDFVHVPGHAALSNERITGGKYPRMSASANPSYDAHLFLSSLRRCLRRRGVHGAPQAEQFLNSLQLSSEDRLVTPLPHCTPAILLRHAYFRPLRAAAAVAAPPCPTYGCDWRVRPTTPARNPQTPASRPPAP